MSGPREALPVGWRPGAFVSAALCAAAILAAAMTVRYTGPATGGGVLLAGAGLALAAWHEAWIEGPRIHVRAARSRWRVIGRHARSIARFEYRRGAMPRLSLHVDRAGVVLRATGPSPRAEAFRQAAMWLIVHGRRQARIDPVLLDALAAMTDHAHTGQPHDTSHA